MRWTIFLVATWVGLFGVSTLGLAEEPAAAGDVAASSKQLRALVKQLDADSFAKRQEASSKLFVAGRAAVEPLAKVATGESLEARTRAFAILERFVKEGDAQTKTAARGALEKIVAGENKGTAERVKEILGSGDLLDSLARSA